VDRVTGGTGLTGYKGITGSQVEKALQNFIQAHFSTGLKGSTGLTGNTRLIGSTGAISITGLRDSTGLTGAQAAQETQDK
jgi:hypothetical protein